MSATSTPDLLENIIVYDQNTDQLCVNLNHDIKVFYKSNHSIMVKNFRDNNCIAVAGERGLNETRLFSMNREDINVHHNSVDAMGIEIIERDCFLVDELLNTIMPCVRGTIVTLTKPHETMFNYNLLSCEDIFNPTPVEVTAESQRKALDLINTCHYDVKEDGEIEVRFSNGLSINQFSMGLVKIFYNKYDASIMMSPRGSAFISLNDATIISSNSSFHAIKGTTSIKAINGVIQPSKP